MSVGNTPLSLLVLDDDPEDQDLLCRYLAKIECWSLETTLVHTWEAAQERLREAPADVLILDNRLGSVEGLDIIAGLRQAGDRRAIILLTGFGDEPLAAESIRRGADDYLSKDALSSDALRRSIQTALVHRQLREEKLRAAAELRQAQHLEGLGRLAGGVAHDLNNVLAAILGLATLQRENLEEQHPLRRSLDTIAKACRRGSQVINSLLLSASRRLEAPHPVDLNGLVRDLIQLLARTTFMKVKLELDLEEPLHPVLGDEAALENVLMNLCVNAVDAMPSGGTLRIRTENAEDGGVRVFVQDSGEGIPAELLEKVFDPFFTTKPTGKGTGLGLAMVYGTMHAHQGLLEIRSEPGLGTEVRLAFPPMGGPVPESLPEEADPPPSALPTLDILLVDDDELIWESLPPMLESMGHAVRVATCGEEGLALLAKAPADLVVLDLNMPGMGGAETLRRILRRHPDQAVLIASGFLEELPEEALGSPAIACLRKPFRLDQIREKIRELALASGRIRDPWNRIPDFV